MRATAEDDAIVLTMNAEAMEMGIRPAEGNLEGEMKIGDGMIRADEESAPNQRANATQPDMQPIDFEGRHSTPRAMREPTKKLPTVVSPRFAPVSCQACAIAPCSA